MWSTWMTVLVSNLFVGVISFWTSRWLPKKRLLDKAFNIAHRQAIDTHRALRKEKGWAGNEKTTIPETSKAAQQKITIPGCYPFIFPITVSEAGDRVGRIEVVVRDLDSWDVELGKHRMKSYEQWSQERSKHGEEDNHSH